MPQISDAFRTSALMHSQPSRMLCWNPGIIVGAMMLSGPYALERRQGDQFGHRAKNLVCKARYYLGTVVSWIPVVGNGGVRSLTEFTVHLHGLVADCNLHENGPFACS